MFKRLCNPLTAKALSGRPSITEFAPSGRLLTTNGRAPVRLGRDDEFSYDYVRSGLEDLVRVLDSFCIQSVAIAPLLSSRDIADDGEVLTMIGTALGPLKDKKIYVYVR